MDVYGHVNNARFLTLYEEARVALMFVGGLEHGITSFEQGVVISHDRMFLDRVATHMLAWEGDDENPAKWFWFEGNFESYEKNKIERLGADAARPHAVTHRKLTRD